jgi:hypothetical protein
MADNLGLYCAWLCPAMRCPIAGRGFETWNFLLLNGFSKGKFIVYIMQ